MKKRRDGSSIWSVINEKKKSTNSLGFEFWCIKVQSCLTAISSNWLFLSQKIVNKLALYEYFDYW